MIRFERERLFLHSSRRRGRVYIASNNYCPDQKMNCSIELVLFLSCCCCLLFRGSEGTLGVDLATSTSESAFSCLKEQGYEFIIVRAFRSYGEPDRAASTTIRNAQAAGFKYVDVYMFPCPKCASSAAQQVEDMGIATCFNIVLRYKTTREGSGVWLKTSFCRL